MRVLVVLLMLGSLSLLGLTAWAFATGRPLSTVLPAPVSPTLQLVYVAGTLLRGL